MNVSRIELENFTSHKFTIIELPFSGIVLVTGPNGGGKSSVVEGVSYGLWGEMLRGASPWQENVSGKVSVTTDVVSVLRVRNNKKTILRWGDAEYETTTKSQQALTEIIGQHDIWRMVSVFSSQDAFRFSTASDAERKRLLESILGLSRFDEAHKICRDELCVLKKRQELASNDRSNEIKRHAQLSGAVEALVGDFVDKSSDIAALETSIHKINSLLASASSEVKDTNSAIKNLASQIAIQRGELLSLSRRLQLLSVSSSCPTCGQVIAPHHVDGVKNKVDVLNCDMVAVSNKQQELDDLLYAKLADLDRTERHLSARLLDESQQLSAANVLQQQYIRAETEKAKMIKQLDDIDKSIDALTETIDVLDQEIAVVSACEVVLGLKGVRASILAGTLLGLQELANYWLSRVADNHIRLQLLSYTENKSGGVSDKISMVVDGVGGGYGYKGASGGERRRIDILRLQRSVRR